MKKITTLGKRILAKKVTDKPESKIIYADQKFKYVTCEDFYCDQEDFDSRSCDALQVNIGTEIIVKPYTGQQVTVNDEDFTIFNYDDIVAIIEGD